MSAAAARSASVLGDPRFFERAGPFSLAELAAAAGGTVLRAEAVGGRRLTGVGPLQAASADEVAVLHNPRYGEAAEASRAGAIIVGEKLAGRVPQASAAIVVADPHLGWAQIASLFHPAAAPVAGIHPRAAIDPSARIDASACIGPCAVIGARAEIGPLCQIDAGAVIGEGVVLGEACRVGANASISHALLGARVHVYPGARIGQEGFGFAVTPQGMVTVPQLGRVILEDGVEVGANSCVDRGASRDTVIGRGTRIDNLIQIAHNVQLGRACVMAAQAGIAGSATVEDYVQIGAQAGLAGHITIGARARVGAQCGVMSDLAPGLDVVGSPAMPIREFFRNVAVLRKLAKRGVGGDKAAG